LHFAAPSAKIFKNERGVWEFPTSLPQAMS
jgi:hypothetical protein